MKIFQFSQWTNPTDEKRNALVFESKNKAYGAYQIRRNYDATLIRALVFTSFTFVGLFLIPKLSLLFANPTPYSEILDIPVVMTPPPIYEVKKVKKPEERLSKSKSSNTKTTNPWREITDELDKSDTLTVDDQDRLAIGSVNNSDGKAKDDEWIYPDIDGDIGSKVIKGKDNDNTILGGATEMPEYYGGDEALSAFLRNNLKFPGDAIAEGIGGKVVLGFVIEKDGSVSNIAVLTNTEPGYGFDKEAIRVLKAMPKWKPGKQYGSPARVRYNIPFSFTLM